MFRLHIVDAPGGPVPDELAFDRDVVYLGRRDGCDILLPAEAVSAVHARIDRTASGFTVTDTSANGTQLNGVRLPARRPAALVAGDRLQLGPFTVSFDGAVAPGTRAVETPPATTRSIARRMVGEVLSALGNPATPLLRVTSGPRSGTQLAVTAETALHVGRDDSCELALPDPDASRKNSRILRSGEHTVVVDLASKNGTLVNDEPIQVSHTLRHGDRLTIGGTTLLYEDPTERYLAQLSVDQPEGEAAPAATPVPAQAPAPAATSAPRPWLLLAIAAAAAVLAIVFLIVLFK